ncbi:class I SAM-dependent methyltransferase [Janthinobacterium aquaticum]|uniref:class I SAM-dependent methyltransferase n=1 Tax=Janthinobacterium sp. FT58W TaxID=2654254 RepID=UPI001265022E|nr:class I SAM-dependent methyltransferase [Janthinobacterium sp. FT58W]KAB8041580.1 class I SAM-dependent methyltransferase [Janthinobacterium sp. FT58W]
MHVTVLLVLLLSLLLVSATLALLLHKTRRMHLMLYSLQNRADSAPAQLYRQLEALTGLQQELQLARSLPPTRGWAASPDFLLALVHEVQASKPRTVLECSSGASTVVLARCLQQLGAGRVLSLEHDVHFGAQTRRELARHGLSDWAQVIDAPLCEHALDGESWAWYDIKNLPADLVIDLLVIDGPPQSTRSLARYPAGPLLFPLLAAGAAVYLDDAARADEQTIVRRWRAAFAPLQLTMLACEKGCAVMRLN